MIRLFDALENVFRCEAGQVLAALIGQIGDFDLAEDALQDAIVVALERWPHDGIPPNPGAWLMTTARRKAIDRLRRQSVLVQKQALMHNLLRWEYEECTMPTTDPIPDDRLKLLFTCCHTALNLEARVALTLRTLGGLSTAEVAQAFFQPIPTMAQRLTRAKHKIRAAHIPYQVPALDLGRNRRALYCFIRSGAFTCHCAQPRCRCRHGRRPARGPHVAGATTASWSARKLSSLPRGPC